MDEKQKYNVCYQGVSAHEAMQMVADKDTKNLYVDYGHSLECTHNLSIPFSDMSNRNYFKKIVKTK